MPDGPTDRRPLKSRSFPLFISLARFLAAKRIHPNAISIASTLFAIAGGICLLYAFRQSGELTGRILLLAAGMLFMLRLLANMLDGMVAVEGELGTPTGELFNEVPDRISDAVALICAGYALYSCPALGYIAAILAVMTAYIRAVGKAAGAGSDFSGLMDKKRRMILMTLTCAVLALAPRSIDPVFIVEERTVGVWRITLVIIAIGSLITCITRLYRISRTLTAQASSPHK